MVVPDDIVVGDEDGVVVIPRHLVSEVARQGSRQELVEAYVKRRIELGALAKPGLSPTERVLAEYDDWVARGRPELR